ncbi:MAG TPA: hypothetical protein VEB22_06185, partial [Phycisphaerales bacterium]|nr:hypothetical protein [Phycisphaerales bacterium]
MACVRSRAALRLVAIAGVASATAGSALADVLSFTNTCGTGLWGSTCPIGGGQWAGNWGLTGPNPALLLPDADDQCTISEAVVLNVSPTIASLLVPAGATLQWDSVSLTVGALTNQGTVSNGTGFNKFLIGTATSSAGAQWLLDGGTLYLQGGELLNNGVFTMLNNGSIRRSGGTI